LEDRTDRLVDDRRATAHRFSRRRVLAMSAVAGGFAFSGYRDAAAQGAKRIERLDPALGQIIDTSEPNLGIATHLCGTANVEGPLWWKEGGYLLFRGTDQNVWSGRALQEKFFELADVRSCINVSGLGLEPFVLRAIMDISARAISLAVRPQRAIWVTS